jgi:ubiquinone/menaquinone biosynthesis C-methylase UbiE
MLQKSEQTVDEPSFFDFAAEVGLTKHLGSIEATEELIELCKIDKGAFLLDVGCGVGVTPCYIAKRYGCRVIGVDISERMIERSKERANREGVLDKVEFRVADAQDLPFDDDFFDAVITESVTAFPKDKQRAVNEYCRVIKQGGYVGLNESTWLKTPPPPEMVEWASQDLGAQVKPLTSGEWVGLLENAGLKEIAVRTYEIQVRKEAKGILRRYGYGGMLRNIYRAIILYAKSPDYRRFLKDVRSKGIAPDNIEEYFGYGIYVGRK